MKIDEGNLDTETFEEKKYVDASGNFTHTKIEGSDEEIEDFIKLAKEKLSHLNLDEFNMHLLEQSFRSKYVPIGILLEMVMPSSKLNFQEQFSDIKKLGCVIKFDLPPYIKRDDK